MEPVALVFDAEKYSKKKFDMRLHLIHPMSMGWTKFGCNIQSSLVNQDTLVTPDKFTCLVLIRLGIHTGLTSQPEGEEFVVHARIRGK